MATPTFTIYVEGDPATCGNCAEYGDGWCDLYEINVDEDAVACDDHLDAI